jgi:hypothetical protein
VWCVCKENMPVASGEKFNLVFPLVVVEMNREKSFLDTAPICDYQKS